MENEWRVLFIGGTSGAGKTTLAHALSAKLGIDAIDVDSFRRSLREVANEETLPNIHYFFNSGGKALDLEPDQLVQRVICRAEEVSGKLKRDIEIKLSSNKKVIYEGDDITPEFVRSIPQSHSIFILEQDISEIEKVTKQRDPNFIDQNEKRRKTQIETTMKYGNWIRDQANNLGLKILNARPEATLISRAYDFLQIPH